MNQRRPWLKHYDPGVPGNLNYAEICIHDLLRSRAETQPTSVAIIDGTRQITYSQLFTDSSNFASNLIKFGLDMEDKVGICLPNSIEFAISFYGVLMAGGIVAALNPTYPLQELQYQINTAEIRFAIVQNQREEEFLELSKISTIEKIFILDNKKTGFINNHPADRVSIHRNKKTLIKDDVKRTFPNIVPDSAAVFQFSGGTTGIPKAAIASHRNIVANVTQFRSWLVNLEEGIETFLVAIPLYHVYGMVLGLNLGIAMGARMVFLPDARKIDLILQAIHDYQVSYFPGVPSIFHQINLNTEAINNSINLSGIKACISGSAPLPESVKMTFEERTGGHLIEGYGLSEAPTATHCNPIFGENKNLSIGLPLPDVECKIVAIDSDKEVPDGDIGELLIRGPQVMIGYYKNPVESANVLNDGWLHTGDIARMDEEGYFFLVGRRKDLIKVHGLQVWPSEIEAVLMQHPQIIDCAVAGVPDGEIGEKVKVWIVVKSGGNISLEEVQAYCENKLVSYKIPSEVEIVDLIPKTSVGKTLRRELVKQHLGSRK